MKKQTLSVAVETKKGVVKEIGRSAILQPKPSFNGGAVKWYVDKPKQKSG